MKDPVEQTFGQVATAERRKYAIVQREYPVTKRIHDDSADQGHYAHHESNVESVPGAQIKLGKTALQYAAGHHVENRPHRIGRCDTHRNHQHNQKLDGKLYPARRFVGSSRESDGLTVEEHVVDES